jgi:succinate dehydrogenase/fumarate reductase flavoprotein subunit
MATSTEHESDLPHFVAHLECDGGYARPGDAMRLECVVMGQSTEGERQRQWEQ